MVIDLIPGMMLFHAPTKACRMLIYFNDNRVTYFLFYVGARNPWSRLSANIELWRKMSRHVEYDVITITSQGTTKKHGTF